MQAQNRASSEEKESERCGLGLYSSSDHSERDEDDKQCQTYSRLDPTPTFLWSVGRKRFSQMRQVRHASLLLKN
jgi:hypothetical protein